MELKLNPGLCFSKPQLRNHAQHKTHLKQVRNWFGLKFTGCYSFVRHPDLPDLCLGHSVYVLEFTILHPHQKPMITTFENPFLFE